MVVVTTPYEMQLFPTIPICLRRKRKEYTVPCLGFGSNGLPLPTHSSSYPIISCTNIISKPFYFHNFYLIVISFTIFCSSLRFLFNFIVYISYNSINNMSRLNPKLAYFFSNNIQYIISGVFELHKLDQKIDKCLIEGRMTIF